MGCTDHTKFKEFKALLPDVCKSAMTTPDSQFVFVMEELSEFLSPVEIDAVLAHEEGHYVHGHLDGSTGGITANEEYEFAADDYAVSVGHSPAVLAGALGNMGKFVMKYVGIPQYGDLGDDILELLETNIKNSLAPRIARLEVQSNTIH